MTPFLVRSQLLGISCSLLAIFPARADESLKTKSSDKSGPVNHMVREYTKEWTDDYGNYHKDVYVAYTKTPGRTHQTPPELLTQA